MAQLTTSKALRRLLYDEDYLVQFMKAGFSKADRRTFRHRLESGKLSTARIESILSQCGAAVVQEKVWDLPRL
jgi:hypothetical protein